MPRSIECLKTCGSRRRRIERNGAVSRNPDGFFGACIPQSILINLISIQISGGPPPYSIFRTVKGLPPSGFRIGRISRASRNSQLHLLIVWARMPTSRRSFRTWASCTRPIIRQRLPGRLSMTMCRLLDWVSEHAKRCSIRKSVLLILVKFYRKRQVRDRRGNRWFQAWGYTQAEP